VSLQLTRPVGQPGCGHRVPQPGQLTIGEELLGYHNNNNNNNNMIEASLPAGPKHGAAG